MKQKKRKKIVYVYEDDDEEEEVVEKPAPKKVSTPKVSAPESTGGEKFVKVDKNTTQKK